MAGFLARVDCGASILSSGNFRPAIHGSRSRRGRRVPRQAALRLIPSAAFGPGCTWKAAHSFGFAMTDAARRAVLVAGHFALLGFLLDM